MHHRYSNKDDETVSLAGVTASSLVRHSGQPVILVYRGAEPPPRIGSEGATSLDCWEGVGEVAVNLVARFRRPSCRLLPSPWEDHDGSAR